LYTSTKKAAKPSRAWTTYPDVLACEIEHRPAGKVVGQGSDEQMTHHRTLSNTEHEEEREIVQADDSPSHTEYRTRRRERSFKQNLES
jgi:hypothetical protein